MGAQTQAYTHVFFTQVHIWVCSHPDNIHKPALGQLHEHLLARQCSLAPLTLITICWASASSGLFFTHTRTQGTCKEHNKSLVSLALCPTSFPHKGYLTARHLTWKAGPGPNRHLLLCSKDLLTGNCLVPFHPKQEVPATVQRTG